MPAVRTPRTDQQMRSWIALFPGGVAGAGLLLLRFSVATSTLLLTAAHIPASYVPHFIGVFLAIGLCIGLQTRVAATGCLLASLLCLITGVAPGLAVVHAISAAALVLTGPGALSIDARLFGRRTVQLPDRDDPIV